MKYLLMSLLFFLSMQIIELEDSIVQLKEDLAHEREESRQEKEKLKQSVVSLLNLFLHYSCSLNSHAWLSSTTN